MATKQFLNVNKGKEMRIVKISEEDGIITDEMEKWFEDRTNRHISLVQKYAKKIEDKFPECDGLVEQAKGHDSIKFEDPEKTPYVYISWDYKCKDDGKKFKLPADIKEKMNKATNHHVTKCRHHPEFHCGKKADLINRDDRDKPPDELVDATKMNDVDIGEMCADWMGMSEEKGNTPQEWAKKNVNIRWKFSNKQVDLIYKILDEIWEDDKK